MLSQKTIVDNIGIDSDGTIHVRMMKIIVNGDVVLVSEPHRTSIIPGMDAAEQLSAVNKNLVDNLGASPVASNDWQRVIDLVGFIQTPEVIEAYQQNLLLQSQLVA